MNDFTLLISLFIMGLVSTAHCIGMCGGIMGALTMAIPADAKSKRWRILVAYNLGRITSYALMGLLAGFFAAQIAVLGGTTILRVIAGLLLIAMGLYLADWWRGLTKLETLGRYLWVYLQPLGKPLMPVNNLPKALFLGALWGWLPCGLVYAALATAMTQPAPLMAASAMLAFGFGTLPVVLAAGFAAQQLTRILQERKIRRGLGLIVIVFGGWTIWGGVSHSYHEHQHSSSVNAIDNSAMDHSQMDHESHSQMDHSHMNHNVDISPVAAFDSEQQRTETDTKSKDKQNSSNSRQASSESAVSSAPIHHHQN